MFIKCIFIQSNTTHPYKGQTAYTCNNTGESQKYTRCKKRDTINYISYSIYVRFLQKAKL